MPGPRVKGSAGGYGIRPYGTTVGGGVPDAL